MILRKYMSLLGIGSARIDLVLPKETYKPGEQIKGYFLIQGGTVDQRITSIECDLVLENSRTEKSQTIDKSTIFLSKMILADELNKVPFLYRLPDDIPFLDKEESYRFKTKLTFDKGTESIDQDWIKITRDKAI